MPFYYRDTIFLKDFLSLLFKNIFELLNLDNDSVIMDVYVIRNQKYRRRNMNKENLNPLESAQMQIKIACDKLQLDSAVYEILKEP